VTAPAAYEQCRLCGRKCGTNRTGETPGFCGCSAHLKLAWAGIHYGEEPVIRGQGGSGAVFVSGCTLKCFFCQNHQISSGGQGRLLEIPDFEDICLMLQRKGAENINIITGTHFIPSLAEGIKNARKRKLRLPVVWNSSGYEAPDTIPLLNEFVDIYLPDLKTLDPGLSRALFGVSGYPRVCREAIRQMAASRPLRYKAGGEGVLASGVIVRHLVLPGLVGNTREVIAWFAHNMAGKALLSLMFQYTPPAGPAPGGTPKGEWTRTISSAEYEQVLGFLEEFGIEEGFVQEPPGAAESPRLPDFSRRDAFPRDLAESFWFCGDFR
jgi:putative pyruvate formate lyase activating enzyme